MRILSGAFNCQVSAEGFIAYDRDINGRIISQPFPAICINPLDVAGAGDSVLSILATGLSSGESLMHSSALACCMAALQLKQCNTPISFDSLGNYLMEVLAYEICQDTGYW